MTATLNSSRPTSILTSAMLETFAARAPQYDRENRFFAEDFSDLKVAGYLKIAVPVELGGAE
jgi:alkylation response protein AidB-like acyl-CoA dehydrogenase